MIKKKSVVIFMFIIFLIFVSLYIDNLLFKYIFLLRNNILDNFFLVITFISSKIIIFLILTALFLSRGNKRKWVFPLWACLGLSALIGFALKITIQRERPFQLGFIPLLSRLQETSYSLWNFSFPSFHTMLVFCVVPILSKQFPKLKKFWIGFAVLVALSRIYLGLHFLSDVIAGGLIGYLIGIMVVRLEKENRFGERIYQKIFRK